MYKMRVKFYNLISAFLIVVVCSVLTFCYMTKKSNAADMDKSAVAVFLNAKEAICYAKSLLGHIQNVASTNEGMSVRRYMIPEYGNGGLWPWDYVHVDVVVFMNSIEIEVSSDVVLLECNVVETLDKRGFCVLLTMSTSNGRRFSCRDKFPELYNEILAYVRQSTP